MLFSVSHQQESATGIPMSPPSQTPSHLSPHPTLLDCYRAPVWIPRVMQQIPIGYLFYITAKIFRESQFLGRVLEEEIGSRILKEEERSNLFFLYIP